MVEEKPEATKEGNVAPDRVLGTDLNHVHRGTLGNGDSGDGVLFLKLAEAHLLELVKLRLCLPKGLERLQQILLSCEFAHVEIQDLLHRKLSLNVEVLETHNIFCWCIPVGLVFHDTLNVHQGDRKRSPRKVSVCLGYGADGLKHEDELMAHFLRRIPDQHEFLHTM